MVIPLKIFLSLFFIQSLSLPAHHRHPQPATVAQRSKAVWTWTSDLSRPSEESQVRLHPRDFELLLRLGCIELELKKLFSELSRRFSDKSSQQWRRSDLTSSRVPSSTSLSLLSPPPPQCPPPPPPPPPPRPHHRHRHHS